MEKETIFAIIIGVLIVVSAIQAIQLVTLSKSIQTGTFKASTGSNTGGSTGNVQVPSNLENLPGMVGGC